MSVFTRSLTWRSTIRSIAFGIGVLSIGCGREPAKGSDQGEQVLVGLRPPVAIKGAPPVRWRLEDRMRALHVPGVSVAVIDSGRVVWARGFGVKEAGDHDSVTTETLFQAQSISKPVAVTGMLHLVEEGKLSLDGDINSALRSWRLP